MNYTLIPGFEFATIRDANRVKPQKQLDVYHGTAYVDMEQCWREDGLPFKGSDIDLVRHVEPPPADDRISAFIGSCPFPLYPGADAGAALWAGVGGWVYHITNWPGYDINSLLSMQIPDGRGGFRGPHMVGEQEVALPARIPMSHISKIGRVRQKRGGLAVDFVWSAHE
jgi:hypothetical protein